MERREGRAAFRPLRPRRAAESHVRRIQTCATSLCGMTLRTALTVLLAVGLMPLWGEAPGIELAQAGEPGGAQSTGARADEGFVGTTDYNTLFEATNLNGEPALIEGSTLRAGSTLQPEHYDFVPGDLYPYYIVSDSAFLSRGPVSLTASWTVRTHAAASPIVEAEKEKYAFFTYFSVCFLDRPEATKAGGLGICTYGQEWTTSMASPRTITYATRIIDGVNQTRFNEKELPEYTRSSLVYAYDAAADTFTVELDGEQTMRVTNVRRDYLGGASECWLGLSGGIGWRNDLVETLDPSNPEKYPATQTRTVGLTFDSMALPKLDPEISGISLYRYNDATKKYDIPVEKHDVLGAGEVVQVRCTVRNKSAAASADGFDEQYSMHLKLAHTTDNPTQGIAPFAEAGFPMEVVDKNGTVTSSVEEPGPETLSGKVGVPITLSGNDPVSVTYFARINQADGHAVKVSHELIEDTFQGSQFATAELIADQELKPAPPSMDPDDPDSGAGTAFHYTRLPIANENGWNRSPVAVTFYAGDFDELLVTASDGGALGTLADREAWRQTADTDGVTVSLQARSTAGALSKKGTEAIRIDTHAPALRWDASAGTLTADDSVPPSSGKAVAGVWKVYRVKADGRALDTDDVTKSPVVGASARSLSAGSVGGDRVAMSRAEGQAAWDFDLTDGVGATVQTVASPAPGFYVAEDAAGNVSSVVEVREADEPTTPGPDGPEGPGDQDPTGPGGQNPTNPPDPETPGPPTVIIKPDPGKPGDTSKPLPPTKVEEDPAGKLSHAVIEDDLTVGTAKAFPSAADFTTLFSERYDVSSTLSDGALTYGPIRIFNADGQEVDAIDRTKPGDWVIEQRIVDSAGNSTTIRLSYHVREGVIDGWLGSGNAADGLGGTGGSSGGDGSAGAGAAVGEGRGRFASALRALPQTGGIFGSCPLHVLFALIMVLASAYGMMRLRQESLDCKERYREAVR